MKYTVKTICAIPHGVTPSNDVHFHIPVVPVVGIQTEGVDLEGRGEDGTGPGAQHHMARQSDLEEGPGEDDTGLGAEHHMTRCMSAGLKEVLEDIHHRHPHIG